MIWPNCKLALAGLIIPLACGFTFYHYVVINPAQEMFKVRVVHTLEAYTIVDWCLSIILYRYS